MTYEDITKLNKRAETRKDGVYSYNSILYAVKDNNFVAFSNYSCELYRRCGSFNLYMGRVENTWDRKKALIKLLNNI